ncbi:hypothetical protein QUF64_02280 [Anaerolineales bacterium HSG6]|nr:hypothetical protein [Anaerolineales bacterium HSG6]MDM8529825.1 hypothetical protein [Anaerolineales bacterium HSG25]
MINFADVEKQVKILNNNFAEGKIDEPLLEKRLLDLIDMAEDGHYWMLGHRSGRWFRHNGETWTLNDPEIVFNEITPGLIEDAKAPPPNSEEEMGYDIIFTLILMIFVGMIIYTSSANWSMNWWDYTPF